ncbi:hypothetical protein [Streptomyces tateyamensis]|uniref:hypothetical protein n=1 Tax=Streptomyces tateyamensis TaxID=565073 RepID=UPI0015E8BBD0|nr:hypothetical protein [Streptomyces tateyamensis]
MRHRNTVERKRELASDVVVDLVSRAAPIRQELSVERALLMADQLAATEPAGAGS